MFIRKKYNKSSKTTSVHIQETVEGKSRFIKNIGKASNEEELEKLIWEARKYISEAKVDSDQLSLLPSEEEIESYEEKIIKAMPVPKLVNYGMKEILSKLFDYIGYNQIEEELFKKLVLYRIAYPVSKLKTTSYILREEGKEISVAKVYRFLDRLRNMYQAKVEQISFEHTKRRTGKVSVLFYDMTTIYFEAEDEDDLRMIGYSKDGKFQCPQIMLGLLIAEDGYPVGYNIYQGNESEGRTLVPILEEMTEKYSLERPITVVADSGLLSKDNIKLLQDKKYKYILGARIKKEVKEIKEKILSKSGELKDGETFEIQKEENVRLIVNYSEKRAYKDNKTREKGLKRLDKKLKQSKKVKSFINQRGYNKFLDLQVDSSVGIDEEKIKEDKKWDGLKGYITNSELLHNDIITQYSHLWRIEKVFQISKTDLRVRPIYHRKEGRIKAHICISFVAYTIIKELETILKENEIDISVNKAIDEIKNIRKVIFTPKNGKSFSIFTELSEKQKILIELFKKIF